MLESKQLPANISKSKFVLIGTEEAREKCLKEAKEKPILMGEHTVGNSASDKYQGDRITQNGTASCITKTIQKRLSSALEKPKKS